MINKQPNLKRKCPPEGLKKPISNELRNGEPVPSCSFRSSLSNSLVETHSHSSQNIDPSPAKKLKNRRRPQTGVKTLTSSDVSEKYNILLDRRLVLIEKQIEQANTEQSSVCEMQNQKKKILKLQEEVLNLEKEEKRIKIELLKLGSCLQKILTLKYLNVFTHDTYWLRISFYLGKCQGKLHCLNEKISILKAKIVTDVPAGCIILF